MKKFKIIFVSFLIFISIHLFFPVVNAHTNENQWFFINDEYRLEETAIPNPSSLLWMPHHSIQNFRVDEEINFKIDTSKLLEIIKKDSVEVVFEIKSAYPFEVSREGKNIKSQEIESINFLSFIASETSLSFGSEGIYYFDVLAKNNGEVIDSEDFSLQIGESVDPAKLKVNEELIDGDKVNKVISRADVITFSVNNPDFEKYNYYLDLGNTDVVLVNDQEDHIVKRRFTNEKMPLYIVLRTEDKSTKVSADSYVRLTSDDAEGFKVVPPAALAPEAQNNNLVLLATFIIFIVIGVLLFQKRQNSKSNQ